MLLTQTFHFLGTFIDLIRDLCLVQEDGEEEISESSTNNHDMRALAIAGMRRLRGVLDCSFADNCHFGYKKNGLKERKGGRMKKRLDWNGEGDEQENEMEKKREGLTLDITLHTNIMFLCCGLGLVREQGPSILCMVARVQLLLREANSPIVLHK